MRARVKRLPYTGLLSCLSTNGQRAVVVLVPVGDDEREHVVAALEQPADVREDEVDAEHLVARELDAAVETTILPRYSMAVMFLPISPRPPSGMILGASSLTWT